jgi:hypothetical protein
MGSHTMDLAWNAIDGGLPTSAGAKGEPFNPDVSPVKLETHFELPANHWRPAIRAAWYQGGAMPESPAMFLDLKQIGHGAMFTGSQGHLVADFTRRMLLPNTKGADLTYYQPRAKKELTPPLEDFQKQWINACKGDLKTACDFEYSGNMIETILVGMVAYRAGKKIKYDGAAGKVIDNPEADALLRKKYRDGWTLNG